MGDQSKEKFGLFTNSGFKTITTYGNLLISYENFKTHLERVYRSKTRHKLPKLSENYMSSDNPILVKARNLYIEYIKGFTGFENLEFIWSSGRKYRDESTTADCVIIQRIY